MPNGPSDRVRLRSRSDTVCSHGRSTLERRGTFSPARRAPWTDWFPKAARSMGVEGAMRWTPLPELAECCYRYIQDSCEEFCKQASHESCCRDQRIHQRTVRCNSYRSLLPDCTMTARKYAGERTSPPVPKSREVDRLFWEDQSEGPAWQ